MKKVSIIYYSGFGHTRKVAQAVAQGAAEVDDVSIQQIEIDSEGRITDEDWDTLSGSDAIVFGSPTYMGNVSWQFKKFADATSKVWANFGWKDKLAAGFSNSAGMNGDKQVTLQYLNTLAMQHGMVWVGLGLMPSSKKDSKRDDINFLSAFTGLMTQSPSDASPEEAPPPGDIETARLFGKRLAEVVTHWHPPVKETN